MALPDLNALKGYLRKETADEDVLLAAILARAGAAIRHWLNRPIEAVERTYRIEGDTQRAWAVFTKLIIPDTPVSLATGEEPEVTDREGTTVDVDSYSVNAETGVIRALDGGSFAAFPYEVTAKVGLALAEDYAMVIEPLIGAMILDYAAELYQHRSPNATQESELGVSTSYGSSGLPPRICTALMSLRKVAMA